MKVKIKEAEELEKQVGALLAGWERRRAAGAAGSAWLAGWGGEERRGW